MGITLEKWFLGTKFKPDILVCAIRCMAPLEPERIKIRHRRVTLGDETWWFDSDSEFFSHYSSERVRDAAYIAELPAQPSECEIIFVDSGTFVKVTMPTKAEVRQVFEVLESAASECNHSPRHANATA